MFENSTKNIFHKMRSIKELDIFIEVAIHLITFFL